MKLFELKPIIIKVSDFHFPTLLEELGGESNVRFVETRNKGEIAIKAAYLDELLIEEDETAQDLAQSIVDAHDRVLSNAKFNKKERIAAEKDLMNQEIYGEIFTYFDTNDDVAAGAWESSWKLRKEEPQSYVHFDIRVLHTSTSFMVSGEPLTVYSDAPTNEVVDEAATEARIRAYYTELVEERLKPFDIFRDREVSKFLAKKAAIEAE